MDSTSTPVDRKPALLHVRLDRATLEALDALVTRENATLDALDPKVDRSTLIRRALKALLAGSD